MFFGDFVILVNQDRLGNFEHIVIFLELEINLHGAATIHDVLVGSFTGCRTRSVHGIVWADVVHTVEFPFRI